MSYIKFNVNREIKVLLSDKGIEHIVKHCNKDIPFQYHTSFREYKNKADEFGYHTMQFWKFLDYFGDLGITSCDYFDINIVFNLDDFEPFEFTHKKTT